MERIDSLLMLEYMISEGFNPNNYERILELSQSAPNSISKDLVEFCNQYLLSKKVIYSELDAYGIDGAVGYVENNNIFVPKTIYNDERFLHTPVRRLYTKHSYGIPSIDEFGATIFYQDSILGGEFSDILTNTLGIEEKFFGFITQKDRNTKNEKFLNEEFLNEEFFLHISVGSLNQRSRNEYELTHDTISKENKELYLIKRKK